MSRRPAALVLVLGAVLPLAACERPTPSVSVASGGAFVRSEALCWIEGGAPGEQSCSAERANLGELAVGSGDAILIDVDPEVGEVGWIPAVNGQAIVPEPLRDTHYRFALTPDQLRTRPELQIYALERVGAPARGLWGFRLTYDS